MQELKTRGIRGANIVRENTRESIFEATREVLEKIFELNLIEREEIAAVYFTLTSDLNASFPAEVAHEMGLTSVPLLCVQEIAVPGSLPQVVRILMLINTKLRQSEIRHVFLGEAQKLREDLSQEEI